MKKIFLLAFSTVLFLLLGFPVSKSYASFTCAFTTTPAAITDQMTKIPTLVIDGKGNFDSNNKFVWLDDYDQSSHGFTPSGGTITVTDANEFNSKFKPPSIHVDVRNSNDASGTVLCTVDIPIVYACTVSISPDKPTPSTSIIFTAKNTSSDTHKIQIIDSKGNNIYSTAPQQCYNGTELAKGVNLGTYSSDNYTVQVYDGCNGIGLTEICPEIFFSTNPNGGTTGISGTINGIPAVTPPPPPCAPGHLTKNGCSAVDSALGLVPTDLQGFVKIFFSIVLTLSGALAVILIIISGYRLMSSQGNPEKLQGAREQLTAAIVGLLFVIFCLFILQVIGVDILGLPGFAK